MSETIVVGWDVGGAHLKAAVVDSSGVVHQVCQQPCPLWQGVFHLNRAFDEILLTMPQQADHHAVTMTGELVDLFATRHEGVRQIINAVSERLPVQSRHIFVGPEGRFKTRLDGQDLDGVASANWLASAQLSAKLVESGLLIDVGSTTTDLLLFDDGRVLTHAYSDRDRLRTEELVYTGVVRTPVMAIADRVPFGGEWVALMAEHFATMSDVYRLCGDLPEPADQLPTADHGEKTPAGSARRLARMLGADMESTKMKSMQRLAGYLQEQQLLMLYRACAKQLSRGLLADQAPLIGAGVGRFLVEVLAARFGRPYRAFGSLFTDGRHQQDEIDISDCAPAVAVAHLLAHEIDGKRNADLIRDQRV
jgi:(4-(4-[2-(gamma-L-glutamylamino)ethyl]phenoxymethyl)furan-2-yl)methanamine synthase